MKYIKNRICECQSFSLEKLKQIEINADFCHGEGERERGGVRVCVCVCVPFRVYKLNKIMSKGSSSLHLYQSDKFILEEMRTHM